MTTAEHNTTAAHLGCIITEPIHFNLEKIYKLLKIFLVK